MTTFENAKVGDKVWDINHGWCEIISIHPNSNYPINVQYNLFNKTFSYKGKSFDKQITQELFWDEVIITPPGKPLPKLEVDTKVLVRDTLSSEPLRRYFSHFEKNGQLATFAEGRTSWSVHNKPTIVWEYWELAKD